MYELLIGIIAIIRALFVSFYSDLKFELDQFDIRQGNGGVDFQNCFLSSDTV